MKTHPTDLSVIHAIESLKSILYIDPTLSQMLAEQDVVRMGSIIAGQMPQAMQDRIIKDMESGGQCHDKT